MRVVVGSKLEEDGQDGELVLNLDALLGLPDVLLTLGLLGLATLEALGDEVEVL